MWLGTTTPLPVAYELNEPSGSLSRKRTQAERRKYVRKHTLRREGGKVSAGKLASELQVGDALTGAHCVPLTSGLFMLMLDKSALL